MRQIKVVVPVIAVLALAGCSNPYDPGQRALGGAGLGAAGGALVGGVLGGGQGALAGAVIGGAGGAVAGAATTPTAPQAYYAPEPAYYEPERSSYKPRGRSYRRY